MCDFYEVRWTSCNRGVSFWLLFPVALLLSAPIGSVENIINLTEYVFLFLVNLSPSTFCIFATDVFSFSLLRIGCPLLTALALCSGSLILFAAGSFSWPLLMPYCILFCPCLPLWFSLLCGVFVVFLWGSIEFLWSSDKSQSQLHRTDLWRLMEFLLSFCGVCGA